MMDKAPKNIKKLFNNIATDYDKLNDIMTFGWHKKIKIDVINKCKKQNQNPSKILDLCCGTGDMSGLLKKTYPQSDIIGVDFSENMLNIAREKYTDIKFLEADCTDLPFENNSFDVCVISFGLRNIEDLNKVLKEILRVLKSDGIFINLDLGKPNKFFNLFLKPYMYIWVALMGKLFHGDETPYKYLAWSNESFPSQGELVKIYEKIGFWDIKNENYMFGQIARQVAKK